MMFYTSENGLIPQPIGLSKGKAKPVYPSLSWTRYHDPGVNPLIGSAPSRNKPDELPVENCERDDNEDADDPEGQHDAQGLLVRIGPEALCRDQWGHLIEKKADAKPEHLGHEQYVDWICPVFVDTFRLCGGGVQMPKTHSPYAPEYRRQMVELVRSGRTPGELAREFECSASAIRNWVRQADRDEGRREDGLTSAELEELRRLRREVRQLREEREILAKATAWFARETGSVRAKSSST